MAKKKSVRRRMRRIPQEGVRPFCYMLYEKERWTLQRQYDKETGMFIGYKDVLNMQSVKRKFESYSKCIAWLTRVKLNIDREKLIWTALRACKIVEGWYTKTGKEILTKEIELPDECTSVQRQRAEQRQLRQQQ